MKSFVGVLTDQDGQEYQTMLNLEAEEKPQPPVPPGKDHRTPQEVRATGGNLQLDLTEQWNANIAVTAPTVLLVAKVNPGYSGCIAVEGEGLTLHPDWAQQRGQSNKIQSESVISYYRAGNKVVCTIWEFGNGE